MLCPPRRHGACRWPAGTLLALALIALPAAAGSDAADRADRLLSALQSADLAAGSLAFSTPEGDVWQRAIGPARVASGIPDSAASPSTRYRIGSISKTMTAVMTLQLAEEGKLRLDEPIARWFPQLPRADRITVEQLLGHRSGLGELQNLPGFFERWVYSPRGERELVAAIATLPPAFEPDTAAAYNNSGYLLLSFIVERAGGRPYGDALRERIATPLALNDTAFDASSGLKPGEAASLSWHDGRGWQEMRASETSVPMGAGGVVSTPRDLVAFAQALFGGRLLKAESLRRMTTERDGFGLGLVRQRGPGPGAGHSAPWGHQGFIDGTASLLVWIPETRTAIAWCGNGWRLPRDTQLGSLRQAILQPAARLPTYAAAQATVRFEVDLGPAASRADEARVSLRGNAAPLSWQENLPLRRDPSSGLWGTTVVLQMRDGVPVEYKYVIGQEGWERTGNRSVTPDPATTLTVSDRFNVDAELAALRAEVLAMDARLFEAFNARQLEPLAAMFSPRLEFFHDRGGLIDHAQNMRQLAANFAPERPRVRRERLPVRDEVFPLGKLGALHIGAHRFCRPAERAPGEACETYRFTHIWERSPAGWQLLRVISFDH